MLSIEASRSDMALLDSFVNFKQPIQIGPGVYDIHSPRVPEIEEIMGRLRKALRVIPAERAVGESRLRPENPRLAEVQASLRNMVEAAKSLRRTMGR